MDSSVPNDRFFGRLDPTSAQWRQLSRHHDIPSTGLLCGPTSIGAVTKKAGTGVLGAHRLVRRVKSEYSTPKHIFRAAFGASTANAPSDACVLSMPPELIAYIFHFLCHSPRSLRASMAVCKGFHAAAVASVARAHAEQVPWCRGVTCTRHHAIELAIAALHLLHRSRMHGCMPTPSYGAVRKALLLEHKRGGIEIISIVESSGRIDPSWPSPPPTGSINPGALASSPFRHGRPGEDSWWTFCPFDHDVSIAATRGTSRELYVGVFVGDVQLVASTVPHGVCAWWMQDSSIAIYCEKFREHRLLVKHRVQDEW